MLGRPPDEPPAAPQPVPAEQPDKFIRFNPVLDLASQVPGRQLANSAAVSNTEPRVLSARRPYPLLAPRPLSHSEERPCPAQRS